MDDAALKKKAYDIRMKTLRMIAHAGAGHLGGDLSETDILTVLFYDVMRIDPRSPGWPERDRYVQSKGHAVETYLTILGDLGYFPEAELQGFSSFGSRYIGHPNNKVPGVEMNSGSLGHGLSVGVGMALAGKMDEKDHHVYVLMGDGELAEGSVWEAAMAAAQFRLDNLTAIVDRNGLQITGPTESVMGLEPLSGKWREFGFHVLEVDGHDPAQLRAALTHREPGRPTVVLAHTVKGKGVSYMEHNVKWHHGVPSAAQLEVAIQELGEVIEHG